MDSPLCLPRGLVACCVLLLCSGKSSLQLPSQKKTNADAEKDADHMPYPEFPIEESLEDVLEDTKMTSPFYPVQQQEEEIPNIEDLPSPSEEPQMKENPNYLPEISTPFDPEEQEEEIPSFAEMDTHKSVQMQYVTQSQSTFEIITEDKTQIPSRNSNNRLPENQSNGKEDPVNTTDETLSLNMLNGFIIFICLGGVVGHGVVIWHLGFSKTWNPFTTYILNLSISDLNVLFCLLCRAALAIATSRHGTSDLLQLSFLTFFDLFLFTFCASQFLLAALGVESCVAVLSPLWHHIRRPPHLSATVCAVIWVLSFLLSAIHFALLQAGSFGRSPLVYQYILNLALCAPLMGISALALSIHVCWKKKQLLQRKPITAIWLALLVFLILSLPLNVTYITGFDTASQTQSLVAGLACSSLSRSLNPLIYFLTGGRQKNGQFRFSMKVALQTVFNDEKYNLGEKNYEK